MPFEGLHAAADAALRAKVGDREAAVLIAEHLLAVVDDAMDQFARGVIIDPRVSFVGDAQLAVEVAGDHQVAIHHLEHDAAQEIEVSGEQHNKDGYASLHPEAWRAAQSAREYEGDRKGGLG